MNLNQPHNTNTTKPLAFPAIALVSESVRTNLPTEEEKSNQIVDYLSSDMIARDVPQIEKHPTNEYDPLDLNDSSMRSTRYTPQQRPIQPHVLPPSPTPQRLQQVTYPMLSFVIVHVLFIFIHIYHHIMHYATNL